MPGLRNLPSSSSWCSESIKVTSGRSSSVWRCSDKVVVLLVVGESVLSGW